MRFRWHLEIRTEPRPEGSRDPALMRWAIVGLAVVGVAAIILWRLATR